MSIARQKLRMGVASGIAGRAARADFAVWAEEEARQKKQVVCLQILILKRKSKLMRTEQFWNNKFLILNKEKTNKNKKLQSWT